MTKNNKCKICDLFGASVGSGGGGDGKAEKTGGCQLEALHQLGQPLNLTANNHAEILGGLYLQQLKDIMLAAYLLKGYYQPAGPLIQHPPPLPPVKGPPPESTPTPPQNSEGSDDLVATSTTSGTSSTGGGFYRTYCPQYYATPPQYQELCYPPAYAHSHQHPPPYYHKYAAPPYRRQYYPYQEAGGAAGPGGSGASPGVVEYQQQPPPGEYLPAYYGGYPPPPAPPPPPPNPAYMHASQAARGGFVDHAGFQSCPCPMQSCPKNGDTGPLIGNGKGAPVATGPGLSLPPSALVGPPSPARGLAGLAPPHGANAWDTDRVQLNPAHRSHKQHQHQHPPLQPQPPANAQQQQHQQQAPQQQQQQQPTSSPSSSSSSQQQQQAAGRPASDKQPAGKCNCAEVKIEQSTSPPTSTTPHNHLKLENNNSVKCESCSVVGEDLAAGHSEDATTAPAIGNASVVVQASAAAAADDHLHHQPQEASVCRVKCESGAAAVKCEQILKCEQFASIDHHENTIDPVAGERKRTNHRHSLPVCPIRTATGRFKKVRAQKPHYEAAAEQVAEKEPTTELPIDQEKTDEAKVAVVNGVDATDGAVCPAATIDDSSVATAAAAAVVAAVLTSKRKLSLDSRDASPGSVGKSKKINKRTLSVGSPRELAADNTAALPTTNGVDESSDDAVDDAKETSNHVKKKLATKKENQKRKSDAANPNEPLPKKSKSAPVKVMASENSIMETINNVIQQSLQMTQKSSKSKIVKPNNKVEKNNKKNATKLLTTLKKAPKNLINTVSVIKNEFRNSQLKITNKLDAKLKKVQNAKRKSNKVKAKLLEVKTKVLEVKNINNKLPDLKNNKFIENKNNKVIELKNNNILETKNNKILESKSLNKIVETKNSKNKAQDLKEIKEFKDVKGLNEVKNNHFSIPAVKNLKTKKSKDCVKNGKLLESPKGKKKGKGGKKIVGKKEFSLKAKDHELVSKSVMVPRKPFLKPKWCNGWSWEGEPFEAKVYLTNEESAIRKCYPCMRHTSGDILRPLDCVLLRSGQKKADLPFVAKIAALWENPDDGEMMFSLLWYYRPEHTEQGRTEYDTDDEVFASRHRDANSVATIEDKCYILTFNEYCRYRKNIRRIEEGLESPNLIVPPGDQQYPRESRQPPLPVPPDMVLFCRRVYDYRGKKLVKNPG